MRAVVFGPGRIGCGFVGRLLRKEGYELTFVTRTPEAAHRLQRAGHYRVRLVWQPELEEVVVDGFNAVPCTRPRRVAEAVAGADLVATAVGPGNLAAVAPLIAGGLERRTSAVNVVAFENLLDAGPYLRHRVADAMREAPQAWEHGFSGGLVHSAVTQRIGHPTEVTFIGDPVSTFVVDGRGLRPSLPGLSGMIVANDYPAWVRRKLYTYSAGHAATAYLGYLKGYHYIHTAIRDPEIRAAVLTAMAEGQQGLAARYGREFAGGRRDLEQIVARFDNAALNDPIDRVGRDPRRKLGAADRLVGAAHLAEDAGIRPEKLALAAAAALCFFDPTDPSADNLHQEIEAAGLASALSQVCGLDSREGLGLAVADLWLRLSNGWERGNLLLSLDQMLWAWDARCTA